MPPLISQIFTDAAPDSRNLNYEYLLEVSRREMICQASCGFKNRKGVLSNR
jgi:hypothetical protein